MDAKDLIQKPGISGSARIVAHGKEPEGPEPVLHRDKDDLASGHQNCGVKFGPCDRALGEASNVDENDDWQFLKA